MVQQRGRIRRSGAAETNEEEDRPPARDPIRKTPRSLSRTLRKLRESGYHRSQAEMAEKLLVSRRKVEDLENARPLTKELSVFDLLRYQDFLGMPTSIILAVSQIFAAARDNKPKHLQVLAGMLGKLVELIATREKRTELIEQIYTPGQRRKPEATTYEDWDNLLVVLIMAAWSGAPRRLREDFRNLERLKANREGREVAGASGGAAGAATGAPSLSTPQRKRKR
jgi:transcriptional regulator with XRE-family HTH domain